MEVERSSFTEVDSAGIRIVTHIGEYDHWTIEPTPVSHIGVVDGDPAYQFHEILFAARLTDGRSVAVDGRSQEVRWFSEAGAHEVTFGGRGGGPGEFEGIGEVILLPGDTLVVHDRRQQRVTWISPEGKWVRERPLEGGRSAQLIGAPAELLVANSEEESWDYSREYSRSGSTVRLLRVTVERSDTVWSMPGPVSALWVRHVNGMPTMSVSGGLPFEAKPLVAFAGGHTIAGTGNSPTFSILRLDGTTTRIIRFDSQWYRPVGEADRQQYRNHRRELAVKSGGSVERVDEFATRYLELVPSGHTIPAFDRIMAGRDGAIWIRRYRPDWTQDDQEWLILNLDGRIDGEVKVNPRFTPTHAESGFVSGVVKDELDVEYVVTYAISSPR